MTSDFTVPLPKQGKKQLSRDDRLRIQTLVFDANFTRDQICLPIGYSYKEVCYALKHRLTRQRHTRGRKVKLDTPQRKKLIQWVTASRKNRETPWIQLPSILGFDCGEYAIRTAFEKEGFGPFVERKKPKVSEENAKATTCVV